MKTVLILTFLATKKTPLDILILFVTLQEHLYYTAMFSHMEVIFIPFIQWSEMNLFASSIKLIVSLNALFMELLAHIEKLRYCDSDRCLIIVIVLYAMSMKDIHGV